MYCCGGIDTVGCTPTAEFYCPKNKFWTPIIEMIEVRTRLSIISKDQKVYAVGGWNGTQRLRTVEVYKLFNVVK